MSTFDYIANSLNVKGNVIKKCIHSEQQIEFIMELNRAVVQCPNCHAKTDRIKDYRWQRIAIGSILHQQAFVRLHKRRYVCPCCGRTFFETVLFLQRYQRKSKDLQMQIMVSCFQKRSFTDIAADFPHLLQRSYVTLTAFISLIPNTFPKSWPWMNSGAMLMDKSIRSALQT